jgi:hypothetical protein
MAGCGCVVVVVVTAGAGVVATVGVGTVVTGAGTVDVVVVGVTGVVGCGTAVVGVEACVRWAGVACPPAKAATVPPRAPITTAMAIPATTIGRLMRGCYASLNNRRSTGRQRSQGCPHGCLYTAPMDLEEIEAIRQLKYRYFRFLDTKRFTELGQLLTDDATTSYQSGELSYQGRDAIVAFLEESLGNSDIVTMHHGHHPEIELTSATTATGVWYLEDRVVVRAMDFQIFGTLLYDDRYVKVDGQWKIQHTGYERIFEEHRRFSDGRLHSFRAMFDTT